MKSLMRTIFVFFLSFIISESTFGALTDGLVAHYPFNGNANDESGNGHNGTVNGATLTTDRFDNTNSAYGFDGVDDHINVGNIGLTYSEFSISLWVMTDNWINDAKTSGALMSDSYCYWCGPSRGWLFWIYDNNFSFTVNNSSLTIADYPDYKDSWVHLVFTKDVLGQTKIYFNGIEETSYINQASWIDPSFPSAEDIEIGTRTDEGWYFKGTIDDIHIYNRAITNSETQQLYGAFCQDTNGSIADGIAQCQADPHTYGLFNQTDIEAATTAGQQAGKQGCIDNPSSCNLFNQADVDAAKTAGVDQVKANPHDYGLFTQTDIDAAKEEGKQTGISLVKADPHTYGLFNQTDITNAEETGKQAGTVMVKADPHAYGLFNQADINAAKTAGIEEGKLAGVELVKANPHTYGLFTQMDVDTAKSTGIAEGKQICITNPADCGIDVGFTQAELDAEIQAAKDGCKSDPASCGIIITGNPSREQVIADCVAAPDSCAGLYNQIQLDDAIQTTQAECLADPISCGITVECPIPQECPASGDVTLSRDLALHIPLLYYRPLLIGEPIPLWAHFQYVPSEDNRILFEVTSYGDIEEATTP